MIDIWNTLTDTFSQVIDATGKPIDPEIFETVIALNVLYIPTVMSCGGHIDDKRGLLLPWVDIEPAEPHLGELKRAEAQLVQDAQVAHRHITRMRREHADDNQVAIAQQRADAIYKRLHEVQRQIRVMQSEVRAKLAGYLSQFYAERIVPFDRRLVLSGPGRTRLHSQGALDFYLTAPEEVQRQKLAEYRAEMAAFTAFLKQSYFSQQLTHVL